MATGEDRYSEMVDSLKGAGCRLTPQRLELVRLLSSSHEHPSAQQLYEKLRQRFPTTSLATVYKTLGTLKELGEVTEIGFSNDDNRYDGLINHLHPHLICVKCKRIIDADVDPTHEPEDHLASTSGYRILSHRVEFYGICPECQRRSSSSMLSQEDPSD